MSAAPAGQPSPDPPVEQDPPDPGRPVVRSRGLFGTEREIVIPHREEAYRLRITRTDKLILTK